MPPGRAPTTFDDGVAASIEQFMASRRDGAAGAGAIVKYICRTHGFEEHNGIYAALNRFFKARQHEYTRIGKTYVLTKPPTQTQAPPPPPPYAPHRGGGYVSNAHATHPSRGNGAAYDPVNNGNGYGDSRSRYGGGGGGVPDGGFGGQGHGSRNGYGSGLNGGGVGGGGSSRGGGTQGGPPLEPPSSAPPPFLCKLCSKQCSSQQEWAAHCGSAQHRIKQLARHVRQTGGLQANAGSVAVSQLDSEVSCSLDQEVRMELSICNEDSQDVTLQSFNLLRRRPEISVTDVLGMGPPGVAQVLQPSAATSLTITVVVLNYGLLRDVVLLDFGGFTIARAVSISCEVDLPEGVDLRPTAPYRPKRKTRLERPEQEAVAGEPPPRSMARYINPPGQHKPPPWMDQAYRDGNVLAVEEKVCGAASDMVQYTNKVKHLLWAEELQHEIDVRQYDMEGVELRATSSRTYLTLQVPGLAENRPSVMRGDALYVSWADGSEGGREWQGFVHFVARDEVSLKFNPDFHKNWISGIRVNVRFAISRSTFNFMQSAISRARNSLHPAIVFGSKGLAMPAPSKDKQASGAGGWFHNFLSKAMAPSLPDPPASITAEPTWSDKRINAEQRTAVRAILKGDHAPLPYLIFGPPGTGKTMTATEAAAQVFKLDPNSRLLLCAPSNSAADLLAQRVMDKGVPASQLLRVCAFSRPVEDLPIALKPVSNWREANREEAGAFAMPDKERIMDKYIRVVAVTCLMAAKLHAQGVPAGHFTHIFIDEAGHAEEPLTLAATAGLLAADSTARLVLAGDPQQLGPIILSPLAQRYGLAVSAMERLISSAPYAASGQEGSLVYNSTFVTKLLTNYRSHPCILRLPNALFYMNDLVVGADMSVTHGCVGKMGFKGLEGRGLERSNLNFPIIFHHVVGKDEREGNSPSWFNIQEVALVGKYVNALLSMRANRLTPLDIGCITAYRKQVQRIRMVTSRVSPEIKVGSVEEFQGQERRAIIMSTVRSSVEHLEFDTKHRLGFLTNPKRFNVAITRAKAMLVIIGNAEVLVNDPQWASLLEYVHRNGGWVGGAPPAAVLSASSAHSPAGTDIEDDWFRHLTRTSDVAAAVSAGGVGGVVAAGPAPGTAGVRNLKVSGNTNASAVNATSGAEGDAELAILEQLSRLSLSQLPATNLLQPTSNGAHPSAAWSNDARDDGAPVPVPETGTATPWGPTDWGFVGAVQVEGGEMPRWD